MVYSWLPRQRAVCEPAEQDIECAGGHHDICVDDDSALACLQDLTKDVVRIDAIPVEDIEKVRVCPSAMHRLST